MSSPFEWVSVEMRADAEQVLAAERRVVEVLDLEVERKLVLQILEKHVVALRGTVADARIEPLEREIADVEIDRLRA